MPEEQDEQGKLNVRTPPGLLAQIDAAAAEMAMNRSEWVIKACQDQLARDMPRSRVIQVRQTPRMMTPARLCRHPLELRSERVNGQSRCLACGSTFQAL
jgi:hypothetical protein